MPRALSLAIVGADHPNQRGPARRFAIALCKPGDPVRLVPEPKNKVDPRAIQVLDPAGVVMGYVRAEQAQWIGTLMRDARIAGAIFQEATVYGCVIRLGLDGNEPVLPPANAPFDPPDDSGLYPDEEWPDEFL